MVLLLLLVYNRRASSKWVWVGSMLDKNIICNYDDISQHNAEQKFFCCDCSKAYHVHENAHFS